MARSIPIREVPAWASNLVVVSVSSRQLDTLCDALPSSHPSTASIEEVDTAIKTYFPRYLELIYGLCSIRWNPDAVPPASWEENMSGSYRPFRWLADCIAGIMEFKYLGESSPWVVTELRKAETMARDVASWDRPLFLGYYNVEVWYYLVPRLIETMKQILSVVEEKGKVQVQGKAAEVRP